MRILQILLTLARKFLMSQNPSFQFISLDTCGIPRMALFGKTFFFLEVRPVDLN